MIPGSRTLITGGTFNQVNHLHDGGNIKGFLLLRQASAPGALHNSGERFDPPKCHPQTRVAVIEKLMDWVRGDIDADKTILWLYGAAGAGKSAIAQTLAEMCSREGQLLASFFFSRTVSSRNTSRPLITTLAYQLSLSIPEAGALVEQAVEANPMIFDQSIETQLSQLLVDPLTTLYHSGFNFSRCPFLIIIDGLDECKESDVQSHIVNVIATAFRQAPFRVQVLIASRPELHLKLAFNYPTVAPIVCTTVLDNKYSTDNDIKRYFKVSFDDIKRGHPLARYIPPSWPSFDVIETLINKSSGQFIYAYTVVKYVKSSYHRPTDRLYVVLGLRARKPNENMPFAELDALYMHILSTVQDIEMTLDIMATIFLLDKGLNAWKIDDLLALAPGDTEICLGQLASVLEYDAESGDIVVLHASLSDFLLDHQRSTTFFLDRDLYLVKFMRLGLRHMIENTGFEHPYMLEFPYARYRPTSSAVSASTELRLDLQEISALRIWSQCSCDEESISRFWKFIPLLLAFLKIISLNDLHDRILAETKELVATVMDNCPFDLSVFLVSLDLLLDEHIPKSAAKFGRSRTLLECDFDNDWLYLFGHYRSHYSSVRSERELVSAYALLCIFDCLVDLNPGRNTPFRPFFAPNISSGRFKVTPDRYAKAAQHFLRYLTAELDTNARASVQLYLARDETVSYAVQYLPTMLSRASYSKELVSFVRKSPFRSRDSLNGIWTHPKSILDLQHTLSEYIQVGHS